MTFVENLVALYNFYFDKIFIYVYGVDPNSPLGTMLVFISILVFFSIASYCDNKVKECDLKISQMKK